MDAQVPHIKWHQAMHTVSPPEDSQLWIRNTIFDPRFIESAYVKPAGKEGQLYIEKHLHLNGPVQFKPI